MKIRAWAVWIVTVAAMLCAAVGSQAAEEKEARPAIQVAILLDTSGSMSGLIDQAKTQLWKIVNELATARKNGQVPDLQVALYQYGNDGLPAQEAYIQQIVPLTTDLDRVSEELFALRTNGGSEFCGAVIDRATQTLAWSEGDDVMKAIFIAGNEPFTQGQVDYRKACRAAIAKGIVVNTIHCGNERAGVDGKWKDGADLADGQFMTIDHNRQVVAIKAPQDKEIARLGGELNKTYLAYGTAGRAGLARQAEQDECAEACAPAGANVQRAIAKSSVHYRNEAWDLVDALASEKVKLEELKDEQLPENMRKMSAEERKQFIAEQATLRAELQERIKKLNDERKKFVAEARKKAAESGENTLDAAIIECVRAQASEQGFELE